MSGSILPTGQQNPQNTAVDGKPAGRFNDQVIVGNSDETFKKPPNVSSGFSLSRSIGRAWHAVKQSVGVFFKKLFGRQPNASTASAETGRYNAGSKSNRFSSNPVKNMPSRPTGSQAVDLKKKDVAVSTREVASAEKNVLSSSPKYTLINVPGNGNCGLYAVLVGMGVVKPSEFRKPTHADYGSYPLPNKEQEFFVKQLRSGAAEIAKEQLREKNGSYSKKNSETVRRLETQHEWLADDDFKYVAQCIGRPIEVYSRQPGGFARTLFQPNGGTECFLPGDRDPSDRNIIRLYLDNGHYRLMQPMH